MSNPEIRNFINPDTLNNTNIPTHTDYSTFLKDFSKKDKTFNTQILEHNQPVMKCRCKTIAITTSLDLGKSNVYIQDVIGNLENPKTIQQKLLYSFEQTQFNNKSVYLIYTKVIHFDLTSYPDIF